MGMVSTISKQRTCCCRSGAYPQEGSSCRRRAGARFGRYRSVMGPDPHERSGTRMVTPVGVIIFEATIRSSLSQVGRFLLAVYRGSATGRSGIVTGDSRAAAQDRLHSSEMSGHVRPERPVTGR